MVRYLNGATMYNVNGLVLLTDDELKHQWILVLRLSRSFTCMLVFSFGCPMLLGKKKNQESKNR